MIDLLVLDDDLSFELPPGIGDRLLVGDTNVTVELVERSVARIHAGDQLSKSVASAMADDDIDDRDEALDDLHMILHVRPIVGRKIILSPLLWRHCAEGGPLFIVQLRYRNRVELWGEHRRLKMLRDGFRPEVLMHGV